MSRITALNDLDLALRMISRSVKELVEAEKLPANFGTEDREDWEQELREIRDTPPIRWPSVPGVYIARMPGTDMVKIGVAKNVARRLRHFKCSMPRPLDLLCVISGGREVESELHARFYKSKRMNGGGSEWFTLTPDLLVFVGEQRSKAMP